MVYFLTNSVKGLLRLTICFYNIRSRVSIVSCTQFKKKGYGHIREKVTESELIDFIEEHKDQYPVQKMCEVLAVPRSSYYGSLEKTTSKRELENQELTQEIQRIHLESKARYGAPKIQNP